MRTPIPQQNVEQMQRLLASIDWKSPAPAEAEKRQMLADKIKVVIDDEIKPLDIVSLIVEQRTFALNEVPLYTTRKGLTYYVVKPGDVIPRSRLTEVQTQAETDVVGVSTTIPIQKLRTGAWGDIQDFIDEASETLLGARNKLLWSALKVAITSGAYHTIIGDADANSVKIAALNEGINWVNDNSPGGVQAVVGRHSSVSWILDNTTFSTTTPNLSEVSKQDIDRTGFVRDYRGAAIVRMPNALDEYGEALIDNKNFFIVGRGGVKMPITQEFEVRQWIDEPAKSWAMRADEMYGYLVLFPERIRRVEIY